MTVLEQVDALQTQLAELMASTEAAQHEVEEQMRTQQADARPRAGNGREAPPDHRGPTTGQSQGQQRSFRTDVEARLHQVQQHIDCQRHKYDAKDAEQGADWAEEYAVEALQLASWAIDQAQAAVVEAADARALAIARAPQPPPN